MTLDAYPHDTETQNRTRVCECGEIKPKDKLACRRCTYLDGAGASATVIDFLRGTDGMSAAEMAAAIGLRNKVSAAKSLSRLFRLGRVRRYWREDGPRECARGAMRRIGDGGGCWVYALDGSPE